MPKGKHKYLNIVQSEGLDATIEVDTKIWSGLILFAATKFGWKPEQFRLDYLAPTVEFSATDAQAFCNALEKMREALLDDESAVFLISAGGDILRPSLKYAWLLAQLGPYGGFRVTRQL